jgi:chromosome segregation ATPase
MADQASRVRELVESTFQHDSADLCHLTEGEADLRDRLAETSELLQEALRDKNAVQEQLDYLGRAGEEQLQSLWRERELTAALRERLQEEVHHNAALTQENQAGEQVLGSTNERMDKTQARVEVLAREKKELEAVLAAAQGSLREVEESRTLLADAAKLNTKLIASLEASLKDATASAEQLKRTVASSSREVVRLDVTSKAVPALVATAEQVLHL